MVWAFTLLSVIIVSAISFAGAATLALQAALLKRILLFLVAFAAGALIGDSFIHLIPEAYEALGNGLTLSLLLTAGMLLFFVVEKIIRWRQEQGVEAILDGRPGSHIHPVGAINLIGDGVHNFIDGLLIGASYLVSIPLGLSTTVAVVLHEIPTEIGDFGVLLHAGYNVKRALLFNFLSGVTAIIGALVALVTGPQIHGFSNAMLPLTAGGFLYIAASNLIPELHRENAPGRASAQLMSLLLGVGVMLALLKVG